MALLASSLIIAFSESHEIDLGLPYYIPDISYIVFFICIYIFYRSNLSRSSNINMQDLLWRVFVTGLIATVLSLILQLFEMLFSDHSLGGNPLMINFLYLINLGLISAFFISTFVVWERFIFYQKSKQLIYSWRIFIYLLLASLLLTFTHSSFADRIFMGFVSFTFLVSIYFSVNLKWVAYLNFKQKWKSILLFILIIIYLVYFIKQIWEYSKDYDTILILDLLDNISLISLYTFIFIYALISVLVILFNLPTSSVFEKKIEEIINFQRLSQSRNTGKNQNEVYDILLESSVSAVLADAAWLDINQSGIESKKQLTYKISSHEILEVQEHIPKGKIKKLFSTDPVKNLNSNRYIASIRDFRFKSILVFPIVIQNDSFGNLVLLKEISEGFNDEMINVISTYINQASISVENFKLIDAAVENERYRKELNIAKTVQRSLLPLKLEESSYFDIIGFSISADEVGGDYYDIYKIDDNKTVLIIGDVSGKGTSAAFHMSQLKGIFQSLVQLNLNPREFLVYANNALISGLDKNSFITVAYYIIDNGNQTIEFSRAGHCPTLYYNHRKKDAEYHYSKGLGLGILRNNEFYRYVNIDKIKFKPDDILVLYTDGITESRNLNKEEFGYDRLKKLIVDNASYTPEFIKDAIMKALYSFGESNAPGDDYTIIIIKFKKNQT